MSKLVDTKSTHVFCHTCYFDSHGNARTTVGSAYRIVESGHITFTIQCDDGLTQWFPMGDDKYFYDYDPENPGFELKESNPTVSDFNCFSEFEDNVVQWAIDRNIICGGSIDAQIAKLEEEFQELKDALAVNDLHEIADAIGDMNVVLTILAAMKGLKLSDCQRQAWNEIKDRKGKLVNGTFVKEV